MRVGAIDSVYDADASKPRLRRRPKSHGIAMKLDKIDIRILCELQKNGRISNVELAELINLSPSPCLMRVKRLQTEGFITGYSAQIDVSKLGRTLTVFAEITLKNHRQIDFARFLTTVERSIPSSSAILFQADTIIS